MKDDCNTLHILVVEDSLGDYVLIEEYLHEEHREICLKRAETFSQAVKLIKEFAFNAILLDLSLPDVDNSEKLVRDAVAVSQSVPVIVLTGYANKEFGVKTLSLGISDYLLKDDLTGPQLAKSIHYGIERKKIEFQLTESEKKYKTLFDLSPLPMFVLEKQSLKFLDVNQAALRLYGYSKKAFLKMTVRDIWLTTNQPEIEKIITKNYNDFFKVTVTHLTKGNTRIHLEVQSSPVVFEGKQARVSLLNNITANVEAERKLEQSEKRFKALVQDGSDLVMIIDFDGKLNYVSPNSKSVLGIAPNDLADGDFFSRIHKKDLKAVKSNLLKLKNNKRLQIPSYRYKHANGNILWIETIFTNMYKDPSVNGIVANSRDITKFVKQEKKLAESLKRYDIVAKATSDTITDYDVENRTMKYNEGIKTAFGYSRSMVEDSADWWINKIHPEDRERIRKETKEIFASGEPHLQTEYRFECANGEYKYILDRSYLVTNEKQEVIRKIGSMQDMTVTHDYIETIERNNSRLKEIAWTQSHVVRAPLARIMGLIDLLKNHTELTEKSELLDHILTSAKELDTVIRKITSKTEQANLKTR